MKNTVGNIAIDACTSCKGMFLDHGEIESIREIVRKGGAVPPDSIDLISEEASKGTLAKDDTQEPCPSCRYGLFAVNVKGVTIDYCLSCRGIWFDRGELQTLVDKMRSGEHIDFDPSLSKSESEVADLMFYFVKSTEG